MAAGKNPPAESNADREIVSTRAVAASPEQVFQAFSDPQQLARWWGPMGFTNTIQEFDLRPGGKWRLIMHGPDGSDYPNEKEFTEVVRPVRIGFRHLNATHGFLMTLSFTPQAGGTLVTWRMLFDSAAECARVRAFIIPANEQNFDRLEAHLATVT